MAMTQRMSAMELSRMLMHALAESNEKLHVVINGAMEEVMDMHFERDNDGARNILRIETRELQIRSPKPSSPVVEDSGPAVRITEVEI